MPTPPADPRRDPARARIEALLARKGGHRARRGDQPPLTKEGGARRAADGPSRERPAAPARTFRRKV